MLYFKCGRNCDIISCVYYFKHATSTTTKTIFQKQLPEVFHKTAVEKSQKILAKSFEITCERVRF